MDRLLAEDLYSLEEYARHRTEFRAQVLDHKRYRRLHLGPHLTLCFEDRLTMQYQVQEMLRIERIFEPAGIAAELAAYNPLIPDGNNWKATLLIEYPDPVWVEVGDLPRVAAIADEDLERSSDQKTSAVHFLRFQLPAAHIAALRGGATLHAGVDHPACQLRLTTIAETVRESLIADLD
jgi:hypothetical protein